MARELLSARGQYLVEGSRSDAQVLARTGIEPPLPILPQANVIKVGGQSFIDRGRAAVFPLIEEIAANLGHHDMIIGTGVAAAPGMHTASGAILGCLPAC